jgi:hypothetical protein
VEVGEDVIDRDDSEGGKHKKSCSGSCHEEFADSSPASPRLAKRPIWNPHRVVDTTKQWGPPPNGREASPGLVGGRKLEKMPWETSGIDGSVDDGVDGRNVPKLKKRQAELFENHMDPDHASVHAANTVERCIENPCVRVVEGAREGDSNQDHWYGIGKRDDKRTGLGDEIFENPFDFRKPHGGERLHKRVPSFGGDSQIR